MAPVFSIIALLSLVLTNLIGVVLIGYSLTAFFPQNSKKRLFKR